jgi:hypothetical protein
MNPVSLDAAIDRPVAEVVTYLADIAHWPEFTDHFLHHWHLTREDSFGRGAGARFRVHRRLDRFSWADLTLAEITPRGRILARGRMGKFNRIRWIVLVECEEDAGGTRASFTVETHPVLPTDRLMEALTFTKAFHRRRWGKALRRLRAILEDGEERGTAATISGGARKPATGAPIRVL